MSGILLAGLTGLTVLFLGGACERREAAQSSIPPPSKLAADASDSGQLPAAEPFQALVSEAFTARSPVLAGMSHGLSQSRST